MHNENSLFRPQGHVLAYAFACCGKDRPGQNAQSLQLQKYLLLHSYLLLQTASRDPIMVTGPYAVCDSAMEIDI
jgi:hypothetical protein